MAEKKVKNIPATEADFGALTQLRNMLDQQSEEAIADQRVYIAGVITELLVDVDEKLTRATRFSRRTTNAAKRNRVKALRKAQREGTATKQEPAQSSQASK